MPVGLRTLVYIASPSYSGSTLMTFLLGSHPEVATVGELKAAGIGDVDRYECSCGTRIRECSFWRHLNGEFERRGEPLDLADFGTHFRRRGATIADRLIRARARGSAFEAIRRLGLRVLPEARRAHRQIIDRNRLFVEVVSGLRGARAFVDSSKDPNRLQYLVWAGYWPVKALYMVRDGRGTAVSYMRHTGVSMEVAATEWRDTVEECDRVMARLPCGEWLKVPYEELCRDPERMLDVVFRFIGLDPARATRDFRSVEQHILGNAMRLGSSSEVTADQRWRGTLGATDAATFERIAGRLNRAHGYTD
jgi:hypothetical protein